MTTATKHHTITIDLDLLASVALGRLARQQGMRPATAAANLLAGLLTSIMDFVARRQAYVEDDTDIPADIEAAMQAVAELACEASWLEQLLPAEFVGSAAIMNRLNLLAAMAEAAIEVEVPVIWTPEGSVQS